MNDTEDIFRVVNQPLKTSNGNGMRPPNSIDSLAAKEAKRTMDRTKIATRKLTALRTDLFYSDITIL